MQSVTAIVAMGVSAMNTCPVQRPYDSSSVQMAVSAAQSDSSHSVVPETDSWAETDFSVVRFSHRWTIHKFESYLEAARTREKPQVLEAPSFSSGQPGDGLTWRASVVFNAGTCKYTYSEIKLALLKGTPSTISAQIKAFVVGSGQKRISIRYPSFTLFDAGQEDCCRVNHCDLWDSEKGYLSEGNLTLLWEIEIHRTDQPMVTTGQQLAIQPELFDLSQDFGSLLESGLFSDVTIMAGVFRAMFDHDMRESVQNRVTINDLPPEVAQEMLTFIYTGRSPNLKKMPGDLLRAADKYDLKQLKARSERELADQVSPENLVDTLLLADQHSTTELRKVCMKLFTTHAEEVVKTEGWSKLIQNGHHLITELVVIQARK